MKRDFLYFVLALVLILSLAKNTAYPDMFSLQKCCIKILKKTIPPLSGLDLENDDDSNNNVALKKVPFNVKPD